MHDHAGDARQVGTPASAHAPSESLSACGERCNERGFLEIDHIVPRALGGKPVLENLRLLCRAHNQYEAERKLGADFMEAKRAQAKAKTATGGPTMVAKGEPAMEWPAAKSFERDVVDALTSLGYKTVDARRAVANIADTVDATFEAQLRAALASCGQRWRVSA